MTYSEWRPIAAVLSAGLGKPWDDYQIKVWHRILESLDHEAVLAAVVAYLAEAEFHGFPPPGAIRLRAVTLMATGGGPQNAGEAWELALSCSRESCEYDAERTIAAANRMDPVTRRVLKSLGGMRAVATTTNLSAFRAQFVRAWEQAIRTETTRPLLPAASKLRGIVQRQKTLPIDSVAPRLAVALPST